MRIFVTGSSSHLAKVLLPMLCEHPKISHVKGVDINPGNFEHKKFSFSNIDVRDTALSQHMNGCDVVIHLAFVVLRSTLKQQRKNRELIHDINVNGSTNVFQQANKLGFKKIIHLSSAAVYGAWPNNPNSINENQARQVMKGFSYAEDKNEVEDWLDNLEKNSKIDIIRLRPHVILGPQSQPFLLSLIRQPFYPKLPDPQPLSQCIWENDVADAIIKSVFSNASGAFNLAAEPAISFKEMIQMSHRFSIPVPIKLLRFTHKYLWHISSVGEEPGWLDGMPYSLAIDSSKAKNELGWEPQHSTYDCINKINQKP